MWGRQRQAAGNPPPASSCARIPASLPSRGDRSWGNSWWKKSHRFKGRAGFWGGFLCREKSVRHRALAAYFSAKSKKRNIFYYR